MNHRPGPSDGWRPKAIRPGTNNSTSVPAVDLLQTLSLAPILGTFAHAGKTPMPVAIRLQYLRIDSDTIVPHEDAEPFFRIAQFHFDKVRFRVAECVCQRLPAETVHVVARLPGARRAAALPQSPENRLCPRSPARAARPRTPEPDCRTCCPSGVSREWRSCSSITWAINSRMRFTGGFAGESSGSRSAAT